MHQLEGVSSKDSDLVSISLFPVKGAIVVNHVIPPRDNKQQNYCKQYLIFSQDKHFHKEISPCDPFMAESLLYPLRLDGFTCCAK